MRHAAIPVLLGLALAVGSAEAGERKAGSVPRAVKVARTTKVPDCNLFVDAGSNGGNGTANKPLKTIAAAVDAAKAGDVICVAEGVYKEELFAGEKPFTLAGGFQSGKKFKVRDSAKYVSTAQGNGGSFLRIEDPGPTGKALTAVDGFDISGYSQAIYRDYYVSQRFEITNNFFHGNDCQGDGLAGAGFALNNVSGTIAGNVFLKNRCWRGGAGFLNDTLNENNVSVERNLVKENTGTEPDSAHGGALYFFINKVTITGNEFVENSVTGWGGGLYLGAYTSGGQFTNGRLAWNVYRGNRAGIFGGGFFCDDSANCTSDHEIYDGNCGGNIYLDGASDDRGPTIAKFDHLTNVNAKANDCKAAGAGVQIDKDVAAPDSYSFTNAIFWGNAKELDFAANCITFCDNIEIKVDYSMVQKRYGDNGLDIDFGAGILKPKNPLFVDPKKADFHLQSKNGRWTPQGYVKDKKTSPALAKGDPDGKVNEQPPRAGNRTELGAYGNSVEASYVK